MLFSIVLSLAMAWVSRRSLLNTHSHGFYRFFAWEAFLALILLNLDSWFRQPLSWQQLISWPLLAVSLFLALHSIQMLS